MAAKPRRIKDKLLHEAYTPVESDADGYSDGVDFAAVVGNKKFHSFQVWRENPSGKPTYVYGLTLKQIEAIRAQPDEKLAAENAEGYAEQAVENFRANLDDAVFWTFMPLAPPIWAVRGALRPDFRPYGRTCPNR